MFQRASDNRFGIDWVIVLASCLHCLWGSLLLTSTSSYGVTSIAGIRTVVGQAPQAVLASLMFFVALLAVASMRMPKGLWSMVCLLPQEAFLVMSAASALLAILHGSYADSVVRPRGFLAADQGIYILLAILYPCAIWKSYIWDVIQDHRAMSQAADGQ